MAKKNKQSKAPKPLKLTISRGLGGFDDAWHTLSPLFEQLQLVSAETASPALDVLTFAHSAHFFGVVSLERDDDDDDNDNHDPQLEPIVALFADEGVYDERIIAVWGSKSAYYALDAAERDAWIAEEQAKEVARRLEAEESIRGIIGFTYLTSSQNMEDYLRNGELCIGIVIKEKCRNRGYGQQAILKTLEIAFEDQACVRVQAVLVDSPYKDRALSLFMKSGMGHEGIRRRGFRSPYDYEFKDVTYLGLLATDWLLRDSPGARKYIPAPKSLWDELFARHQREREELLRWEAKQQLKRTSSMETVRQVGSNNANILHPELDDDEDMYVDATDDDDDDEESVVGSTSNSGSSVISSSGSSSRGPSPSGKQRRRNPFDELGEEEGNPRPGPSRTHAELFGSTQLDDFIAGLQQCRTVGTTAATDSNADAVPQEILDWVEETTTHNILHDHRGESPAFSDNSELESDLSDGYATSTSSQWDHVERESLSGLSDADYEALSLSDNEL